MSHPHVAVKNLIAEIFNIANGAWNLSALLKKLPSLDVLCTTRSIADAKKDVKTFKIKCAQCNNTDADGAYKQDFIFMV